MRSATIFVFFCLNFRGKFKFLSRFWQNLAFLQYTRRFLCYNETNEAIPEIYFHHRIAVGGNNHIVQSKRFRQNSETRPLVKFISKSIRFMAEIKIVSKLMAQMAPT